MRQLWVWLMLGAATGSAAADCASPAVLCATALSASSAQVQPPAGSAPAAGAQAAAAKQAPAGALKVSASPALAASDSAATPAGAPPERWQRPSLGLSLLITALAMLAIAWRRGRR